MNAKTDFADYEVGYDIPAVPGMTEADIQTPCLIVDLDALERNIRKMGEYAKTHGMRHRSHGKMHKSVDVQKLQERLGGAVGICCQKVSEAEVFAKSLPPVVTEYDDPNDPSQRWSINVTLEYLVDHIAEETHADRKIRTAFNRDIANKVLFIKDGRLLFLKGVKLKEIPDKAALVENLRVKHGAGIQILNALPPDEAFPLWKKHTVAGGPS